MDVIHQRLFYPLHFPSFPLVNYLAFFSISVISQFQVSRTKPRTICLNQFYVRQWSLIDCSVADTCMHQIGDCFEGIIVSADSLIGNGDLVMCLANFHQQDMTSLTRHDLIKLENLFFCLDLSFQFFPFILNVYCPKKNCLFLSMGND